MSEIRAIPDPGAGTSGGYAIDPAADRERRESISRSTARYAVLALTIACIVALTALKAAGVDSGLALDALRALFAVAFVVLTLVDFRASVGVAIFELVLGGVGGRWIDFGGGLTGRIFMDAVVTIRALWLTIVDWRRGRRRLLGRYGAHAIAIAILVPAIWIPLGLLNGNGKHNAVSDGNGFLFFAFVLVIVTLLRAGDGAWFRKLFFAACAANAVAYFVLIVVTASGAVSLHSLGEWLNVRLQMGGVIGYMPNGDFRLFTGGSLFVQVGLVLTAQRLLVRPRDLWLWLLGTILTVDLIATYTRGLWLSALISVLLLLALEVRSARQLGLALAIPAAVGALALAVTPLWGFSLYSYVFNRAATIAETGQARFATRVTNPSFEASLRGWRAGGARSVRLARTGSTAHTGMHSLQLSNSNADQDAYAFQNLAVKPKTRYSMSAWVNARALGLPAAGGRGLVIWDAQDGRLYTVPLTSTTTGWRRLAFTFPTRAKAKDIQIRLYAPEGRVFWDSVRLIAHGHAAAEAHAAGGGVQVSSIPESSAAQAMALAASGSGTGAAGAASNAYKVAEAKALWRYIKKRPIYGYGFGKVARGFSKSYSYELSYLDLLLKAGLIGLLFYLSFPLRLVFDALRLRFPSRVLAAEGIGAAGVVVGVVVGVLIAGATNPYLFAAFGLISILMMVAWLEAAERGSDDEASRPG
jgi:O-Antigen ligase/Carbohydrate binding domain